MVKEHPSLTHLEIQDGYAFDTPTSTALIYWTKHKLVHSLIQPSCSQPEAQRPNNDDKCRAQEKERCSADASRLPGHVLALWPSVLHKVGCQHGSASAGRSLMFYALQRKPEMVRSEPTLKRKSSRL